MTMMMTHARTLPRILMAVVAVAMTLTLCTVTSHAYTEYGDAGQTLPTTQYTDGARILDELHGTTIPGRADVDLFSLVITDPAHFSARVLVPQNGRHWLYLFTSTGTPIFGAAPNLFPPLSTLHADTVYLLAVTPFGIAPYAASTRTFKWLYMTLPSQQSNPSPSSLAIRPNGKFSTLPLSDWGGTYSPDSSGPYVISLTGAFEDYLSCDHRLVFQSDTVIFQNDIVLFGRCR